MNTRVKLINDSIKMAEKYERELRLRLWHINMKKAGFELKAKNKNFNAYGQQQDFQGQTIDPSMLQQQLFTSQPKHPGPAGSS